MLCTEDAKMNKIELISSSSRREGAYKQTMTILYDKYTNRDGLMIDR